MYIDLTKGYTIKETQTSWHNTLMSKGRYYDLNGNSFLVNTNKYIKLPVYQIFISKGQNGDIHNLYPFIFDIKAICG